MTFPDCTLEWITKLSILHFTFLVLNGKMAFCILPDPFPLFKVGRLVYGMLNSNMKAKTPEIDATDL